VSETIFKLLAAIHAAAYKVLATTRTHMWWWVGGGGASVAAAVALVLVFGSFFGPSGKAICTATLKQAVDFGVVPYNAALANNEAKSTEVKDRRVCTASSGDETFLMTVDLKLKEKDAQTGTKKDCKDLSKAGCIVLYAVERPNGTATYQVRAVPPDDVDAALPPAGNQAAAGGSQTVGGGDAGASDTADTAVDNSLATQNPSAPSQPSDGAAQGNPQ
jgi:hypothetical protein